MKKEFKIHADKPSKKAFVKNSKFYFGCNIWSVNRAYLAIDKMCNRQHHFTAVLDGIVLLACREGIKYNDKLITWEDADEILTILEPHYQYRFYEKEENND